MAPAGTPRPVIDKLAGAVREALKSNDVVAAWRRKASIRSAAARRLRALHRQREQALE